jgi:hypothetical protein
MKSNDSSTRKYASLYSLKNPGRISDLLDMVLSKRSLRVRRLTIGLLALGLASCNSDYTAATISTNASTTTVTPSPTPSIGSNGGIQCGTNAFCVNVVPPADTTMILHKDGAYSQPCSLTPGTDSACILEADELDLYAQGLTLNYNVPAGMCSYMRMQPYFYYQYQPGIGPSAVTITVDPTTGAVTETESNDGFPSANSATGKKVVVRQPYSVTPDCSADYTVDGGPNCCTGTYALTVVQNGVSSVTTESWGGNPNNCLVGPGVDSQTPQVSPSGNPYNGYPEYTLFTLDGNSINGNYAVASPISKQFFSNAYISNYWQSGATNDYPLVNDGTGLGSPNAMQGPLAGAGVYSSGCYGAICTGNPWYEFDCLDPAKDLVARIRVMVRSWTYNGYYQTFIANQTSTPANGTYNYWGPEPGFVDQPIEDQETWVTPFSTTLGAGTTGTVAAPCTNPGTANQNCGFGSMYPGLSN